MWLNKVKTLWADERTQTALQEMKQIAAKNPKKFAVDALTLLATSKSFESNSLLGSPVLNQLGLHRYRVQLAAQMAKQRRAVLAKHLSAADVAEFEKNGFILKENFLPEDEFAALRQELCTTPLETRETIQGDTVTRRMALDGSTLKQLPATTRLLQNHYWQALLNYVGSASVQPMYYVQVILSKVKKARPDPQTNLHSDTFHANVKAWLFLTDVAADEGPFVYVPGSHVANAQRLAWEHQQALSITPRSETMTRRGSLRIQPEQLAALGYADPQAFAVKKNTLVIADTYGFHARGPSVRPSMRIELWAYARRSPFMPWTGLNPLSLPIVKTHLVPMYWQALDYLEEHYGRKNPWRKVGKKRATDPATLVD